MNKKMLRLTRRVPSLLLSRGRALSVNIGENDPGVDGVKISDQNWNWISPGEKEPEEQLIQTKKNVLLSSDEIKYALEQQNAADVTVIKLPRRLDTISEFVVASGKSRRHLRKLADSIVDAVKRRNLQIAPGFKGVEGENNDDWLLVDCHNIVVHILMPSTRKAINLEDHWNNTNQPFVQFSADEEVYEANFERLLERYPVPEGYNPVIEDSSGSPPIKRF